MQWDSVQQRNLRRWIDGRQWTKPLPVIVLCESWFQTQRTRAHPRMERQSSWTCLQGFDSFSVTHSVECNQAAQFMHAVVEGRQKGGTETPDNGSWWVNQTRLDQTTCIHCSLCYYYQRDLEQSLGVCSATSLAKQALFKQEKSRRFHLRYGPVVVNTYNFTPRGQGQSLSPPPPPGPLLVIVIRYRLDVLYSILYYTIDCSQLANALIQVMMHLLTRLLKSCPAVMRQVGSGVRRASEVPLTAEHYNVTRGDYAKVCEQLGLGYTTYTALTVKQESVLHCNRCQSWMYKSSGALLGVRE